MKDGSLQSLRILLVSEFPVESGAPTGALASDLAHFLRSEKDQSVRFINVSRPYVPGGFSLSRIWNFIWLNLVLWLIFPCEFLQSKFTNRKLCVIGTTSPPLIQWTCAIIARILRVPVIVWYQDAHPEIEARALEKMKFSIVANLLRAIDRKVSSFYTGFITLDEAMLHSFLVRTHYEKRSGVIIPWGTYLEPAKRLRSFPKHQSYVRLIYAGNYGKVHDLTPLARAIANLRSDEKRRLSITFVGMNNDARDKLSDLFAQPDLTLEFKPRFASIDQLLVEFGEFDFGIVSLAEDRAGVACPSKALTYLSQGLPILYVGPPSTLSANLCQQGWGLTLSEIFDSDAIAYTENLDKRAGTIFPNPKSASQQRFFEFIIAAVEERKIAEFLTT